MQLEAETFLRIAEQASAVCTFDIETTGREADYHSVLVAVVKPYKEAAIALAVTRPGDDRAVVRAIKRELSRYDLWITYYGKMFDIPFVDSRLLRWGSRPLPRTHHLDLYFQGARQVLTGRRSQAHLIEWLDSPHKKMTLSPDIWNLVHVNPRKGLSTLKDRCIRDCEGLEGLYERFKPLLRNINR